MQIRRSGRGPALRWSWAVLSSTSWFACEFEHGKVCETIEQLPVTPLTTSSADPVLGLTADNVLHVVHGTGCGRRNDGAHMKLEQSVPLPTFVDRATVFLNGWQLRYLDTDHHVSSVIATLGKIQLVRNQLTWTALGQLSEDNSDEPYEFCYHFTAVGWSSSALSAEVDHDDALTFCGGGDEQSNMYWAANDSADTALSSFRSFLRNDAFIPYRRTAVLPRGFGMGWSSGDDHHLLQLAYNLDHSEAFAEHGVPYYKAGTTLELNLPNGAYRVGDGYVTWQTYAIMKDDSRRRSYLFGEIVSGLSGADVAVIQPAFAILPSDPSSGTLGGDTPEQDIVIENIPYEYAIPMLTGWNLAFMGGDQHVKELGVWISNFSYEKPPGSPGKLSYHIASRLRDKNSWPPHGRTHKVTVLALRAAGGQPGGPLLQ